jgi:glycerol uptake facilitator protein
VAAASAATPRKLGWRQSAVGEYLSEFFGTFILICFGDGVVAMAVAALNQSGRGSAIFDASGDWLIITFGWGFAVAMAVYVAGGVSGAHINPAITLASAIKRGFPWSKVPGYWAAQILGAFTGGALVFWVYQNAINSWNTANHVTKGHPESFVTYSIFATFPAKYFHNWGGPFLTEAVGTAFLVCFVFAIIDEFNQPVKANLAPFMVGIAVVAIGTSFGANSGYAINPARDFGPRIFAAIAGWDKIAFPGNYGKSVGAGHIDTYFWIPIAGPLVGAAIGALIYDLFIRDILQARGEPADVSVEPEGRTVKERPVEEY